MGAAMKPPTIGNLRRAIDSVDEQLAGLLCSRAEHARQIGELKRRLGLPVQNPSREAEVLQRLRSHNDGTLGDAELSSIMRRVVEACRRVQAVDSVACLGPAGSFSHQTTVDRFGGQAEICPTESIAAVFERVASGHVSHGVVPADNTRIGTVPETREAMARHPGLRVTEALVHTIELALLVPPGTGAITRVASKREALAQCGERLDADYPGAQRVETASTSAAAHWVATLDARDQAGALASASLAAPLGLEVRETNLVDGGGSATVFWVLERSLSPRP